MLSDRAWKLVLSRKGFDSTYGGVPSPILPDGRMIPLPIPAAHDRSTLADVDAGDVDLGKLIADLTRGKHSLETRVHIDPDLDRSRPRRLPGWRPALGQTGAAQTHLESRGVGPGDVFLFFGWFREVELVDGRWRYPKRAPHLHVLFGWLEVADVLPIATERDRCLALHPWIADHPHVASPEHYDNPRNTLYVAPTQSRWIAGHPGGGLFRRFDPRLQLTAADQKKRSLWRLPAWFAPGSDRPALSYHAKLSRWTRAKEHCYLQTVAKGQEFVLDARHYPDARAWVTEVLRSGT